MSSRLIWQPDSHRAAPRAFFLLWCLALIAAPWVAAAGLVPARTQWYENRAPEPWPAAPDDTREVNTYPARFESAFTDRLGVRGYLIGLHAWLKYKVFATSPSDAVLVGKEGWLFHNLGANIADHQGRLVLSDADKRKLRLVFEERRDWLAERGIPYLVAIVPEKQTVYDAQVPAWVGDRQGPSAREQLLAYLDEVGSTLDVLDLTPVLRDAAQPGLLGVLFSEGSPPQVIGRSHKALKAPRRFGFDPSALRAFEAAPAPENLDRLRGKQRRLRECAAFPNDSA